MSAFFVTATGTDVGKTYVAAGLIRHLRTQKSRVDALKPIVSGFTDETMRDSDPAKLLEALGLAVNKEEIAKIAPWRFAAPLSPDMAAAREGKRVDFDALVKFCRDAIAANKGTLFIEGVGGAMVPLDERHTVFHWMSALGLPLILVTGTYLGTLSHTLTALDALRGRRVKVSAIVVNETAESGVPLADTVRTLSNFVGETKIAPLARNADAAAFAALASTLGLH